MTDSNSNDDAKQLLPDTALPLSHPATPSSQTASPLSLPASPTIIPENSTSRPRTKNKYLTKHVDSIPQFPPPLPSIDSVNLPGKAIAESSKPSRRRTLETTRRWHKNCLLIVTDATIGYIRHFCIFLMRRFIKYHQQCQHKNYRMVLLVVVRKTTNELERLQSTLPKCVTMHKIEMSEYNDTKSFDTLEKLLQRLAPAFSTLRDQVILVHGPGKLVTHILRKSSSETNGNDLTTLQTLFSDCVANVIRLTSVFLKIFPTRTVNRKIVNINPSFRARQWPEPVTVGEQDDKAKDVNRAIKTKTMKGSALMVTAKAAREAFLANIASEDETTWCLSYDPSAYLLFSAEYLIREKILKKPDLLKEALRLILKSSLTRLLILIEEESLDSGTSYIFDDHWANDLNKYKNVL